MWWLEIKIWTIIRNYRITKYLNYESIKNNIIKSIYNIRDNRSILIRENIKWNWSLRNFKIKRLNYRRIELNSLVIIMNLSIYFIIVCKFTNKLSTISSFEFTSAIHFIKFPFPFINISNTPLIFTISMSHTTKPITLNINYIYTIICITMGKIINTFTRFFTILPFSNILITTCHI